MRALLAIAALALAGCATATGGSPAQRLYEGLGLFNVAKAAAVGYAEAPTASPVVVRELNAINKGMAPSVWYARAYLVCGGVNAGKIGDFNCAEFDFRATTVSGYAIALRSAATTILVKTGAGK